MLPQLFTERMKQMLGEEATDFFRAYEREPYKALRRNPQKMGREEFLTKMPFSLSPVPWEENGFYYEAQDQPGKHPFHEAGVYYIQEPSAMAPAGLLEAEPGEKILDLCAAPGGKSTQIGAAMQGEGILICNEIHPARAKILSENIERMGITNALVLNESPERLAEIFPDYFDRILVDAPCSGEGMFHKNEEAQEEWSPENVTRCAERQDGILDRAAQMLHDGGRLVYSTCTFAPAENEGTILRFLRRHPEFTVIEPHWQTDVCNCSCEDQQRDAAERSGISSGSSQWAADADGTYLTCTPQEEEALQRTIRLWPHKVKGEGHFAAVLKKSGSREGSHLCFGRGGVQPGIRAQEYKSFLDFAKENLKLPSDVFDGKIFVRFGEQLYLAPGDMPALKGMKVLRPGLHLGTLKKGRFEPSHALALALSPDKVRHVFDFPMEPTKERTGNNSMGNSTGDSMGNSKGNSMDHSMNSARVSPGIRDYLNGLTFSCEGEKGWYLITMEGCSIGWGKLAGSVMKNHYPRGLRK